MSAVRKRGRPVGADSEQTRRTDRVAPRGNVITERGYHAATFQQIAARAGVSRPTLHYYFATREQLYEALLADVRDSVDACAAEAVHGGQHCLTQLAVFGAGIQRPRAAEPALQVAFSSPPGSTATAELTATTPRARWPQLCTRSYDAVVVEAVPAR